MALDVKIGKKIIRIIAVYLPHAGYPWQDFQACMDDITALAMEAQDRGYYTTMAGDFNLWFFMKDGEEKL